jgi:type I restriction enzyme S subunit
MVMSDVPSGRAIAKCFIVDKNNRYTVNQRICALKPKIDSRFLFYKINRNPYYLSFDDGVKQTNLRKDDVLGCKLSIPQNKTEQVVIATALSDAGTLVDKLDKLIEKKKNIKQGVMQQLLTGKKRLAGFYGEWKVKKLGEVSTIESGINKPLSFIGKEGAKYVTVLELYGGSHIATDKAGRIEVSKNEITRYSLQSGDIVFGKSSVKHEGIGYPNIFIGYKEPAVFSGFTFRARTDSEFADPFFIIHVLRMPNVRNWLISNSQASALTNINQRIANDIPVFIPSDVKEQTAIATIISDIDAEIESLERELDKYAMLKQGMMQQLLTGKIRIYANK